MSIPKIEIGIQIGSLLSNMEKQNLLYLFEKRGKYENSRVASLESVSVHLNNYEWEHLPKKYLYPVCHWVSLIEVIEGSFMGKNLPK